MGLTEACEKDILPCSRGTAHMRRARDPRFPHEVEGVEGPRGEKLYVAGELHEYGRIAWGEPDAGGRRRVIRLAPKRETAAPAADPPPVMPGGIPAGGIPDDPEPVPAAVAEDPALLAMAAELVITTQFGSVPMLHRKLRVPFAEAEKLMGDLEALMIVGPATRDSRARDVLVSPEDLDEVLQPLRAAA